jgi:hypothetical protein
VAAGSVFLIKCEQAPDPRAVQALFERGLGLRRVEGYGMLRAMPEKARGYREIADGVVALRGLSTRLLEQVQTRIQVAQTEIQRGEPPQWGLVSGIAGSEQVPAHIAEATRFLMTLVKAEELAIAGEVLAEKK